MTRIEALAIIKPEAQTETALKAAFRAAALLNHPDRGGDLRQMQLVNDAYQLLKKCLINEGWNDWHETKAEAETPLTEVIKNVLQKLANLDVKIELCGTWLWVSGNTRPVKDRLKSVGCKWARNKKKWYWAPPKSYKNATKRPWEMEKIRAKYGSQKVSVPVNRCLT